MHQDQAISCKGNTVAFQPSYGWSSNICFLIYSLGTESRTAEPGYGSALTFKTWTHTLSTDGFAISQI